MMEKCDHKPIRREDYEAGYTRTTCGCAERLIAELGDIIDAVIITMELNEMPGSAKAIREHRNAALGEK